MLNPDQLHILIDVSHPSEEDCERAINLTYLFEMQAADDPASVIRTIDQLWANEAAVDPSESDATHNIALTITRLLDLTDHGSFIEFSEPLQQILETDSQHLQLIKEAQNTDRRRGLDPRQSRRRVALNGLRKFVVFQSQTGNNAKKGEVA
jgi:hypothetical protein